MHKGLLQLRVASDRGVNEWAAPSFRWLIPTLGRCLIRNAIVSAITIFYPALVGFFVTLGTVQMF